MPVNVRTFVCARACGDRHVSTRMRVLGDAGDGHLNGMDDDDVVSHSILMLLLCVGVCSLLCSRFTSHIKRFEREIRVMLHVKQHLDTAHCDYAIVTGGFSARN